MTDYFLARSGVGDAVESPISPLNSQARSNPLTTKVTSVLSASYADSEIRDALSLLDQRGLQNSSETRRQLRLDVQKEVIESNGDVIREFGHVAEVSPKALSNLTLSLRGQSQYNKSLRMQFIEDSKWT